jgi:hypothetical protein
LPQVRGDIESFDGSSALGWRKMAKIQADAFHSVRSVTKSNHQNSARAIVEVLKNRLPAMFADPKHRTRISIADLTDDNLPECLCHA